MKSEANTVANKSDNGVSMTSVSTYDDCHNERRYWHLIAAFYAVFSVIPMITRNVISYDMVENLYWGKEWQLGYAKHPPLFAWISQIFYAVCGSIPESLYLLTQLNLFLGLFFVFKISELVFEKDKNCRQKSYASVMIFMASAAAVFGNEKFNATTILMSLLPAMYYFFVRMVKFRKKRDAVLLGLFTALAFLGKYFALLFAGCLGLFLIIDEEGRKLWKTSLPYIAIIVAGVCVSWHIKWMVDSDFITLKYGLDKSVNVRDFRSVFNFIVMQTVFFSTSFLAVFLSAQKVRHVNALPSSLNAFKKMAWDKKFVIFITLMPNILLATVSLLTGMRIGSFWGANMCMLLGTYLVILNEEVDFDKLFNVVRDILIIFAALLFIKLGPARQMAKNYIPNEAIDFQKTAHCIENEWFNQFGNEPMKKLRADKATAALHAYIKGKPHLYDTEKYDQFPIYYSEKKNAPEDDVAKTIAGQENEVSANSEVWQDIENNIQSEPKSIDIVTFFFKENDGQVDKFHDCYGVHILFESLVHVIGDFYVYYAFTREPEPGQELGLIEDTELIEGDSNNNLNDFDSELSEKKPIEKKAENAKKEISKGAQSNG